MNRSFKVKCTYTVSDNCFTKGKVYPVKDGVITWNNGETFGGLDTFEKVQNKFASRFELVDESKPSTETISIYTRKNRVVATITKGEQKFTQSVSLHKANYNFKTAVKMVIDQLMDKFEVKEAEAVPAKPSYRIVKQDKYEVGDKVKLVSVRPSNWNHDGDMDKYLGKEVVIKSIKFSEFTFEGSSRWSFLLSSIEGKVIEDTVKEETPLTADGFKVGDKVRLRKGLNVGQRYGTTTLMPFMVFDGTKTVKSVHEDDGDCILEYIYSKEMLELAEKSINSPSFDWEAFKSGKFAVHCDTEEKAREFLNECNKHGVVWCTGDKTLRRETRWEIYKDETCYGYISSIGISYGTDFRDIPKIDYTPSKPTVKEVSRQGKVGEYIKITNAISSTYKNGDIMKVVTLPNGGTRACGVKCLVDGEEKCVCNREYVVLEGYVPEEIPMVKEISRNAEIGDFIKIVKPEYTDGAYSEGDICQVVELSINSGGVYAKTKGTHSCNKGDNTSYVSRNEYVVLEGYVPEDKPTVKEVKRPAKVGEWIKIINSQDSRWKNGEIFNAVKTNELEARINHPEAKGFDGLASVSHSQYVVLENYQPDNTPLDSKPEPEQPISSTSMREIKREARAGEYVKVVKAHSIPKTKGEYEYANGDVLKITRVSGYHARYADGTADDGRDRVLLHSEYVVLENFDYSVFPKNEPWRKAKVGDKIKVVNDTVGHGPSIKIGDIQTVDHVDWFNYGNIATEEGNVFHDADQEYIIIEEAPEVKPDTIEIGDTVKVVDRERTCDTYREFVEKNAKDFIAKFKSHYLPKNGDTGIVVGQGEHRGYAGNYLVVLSNDKAFVISEKGIEKARS